MILTKKMKQTTLAKVTMGTMQTAFTPPKTNTEPINGGLEHAFFSRRGDFQVPCEFSGL